MNNNVSSDEDISSAKANISISFFEIQKMIADKAKNAYTPSMINFQTVK
jgi:hypothetical protein